MSILLSLDSISHQLGNKQLFQDLKLGIEDNSKIGIIGPNGSGKSTLMKIMSGVMTPDSGRVVKNSSIDIAYIPQVESFDLNLEIKEVVYKRLLKDFTDVEAKVRAEKFLSQVGFLDYSQKVSELSGGWLKRLSIAIALAKEPQLLLLDEPTNHLDLSGLLWLEKFLKEANFSWVLISHDRYFLEKVVDEIYEIAPYYENGIFKNLGGYNSFMSRRSEFFDQQSAELASLKNKHRSEKEWIAKSPRARGTKSVYRIKEFDKIEEDLRLRNSRVLSDAVKTSFTASNRQTKDLVELINVSFSFDDLVILKKQDLLLKAGTKLGVLGTNGQGKSTLLKLLSGQIEAQSGKIKKAHGLKIVYFDQLRDKIKNASDLKSILADGTDQIIYKDKPIHIISWAKRFGFEREDLDKPVKSLSGGEQARVLLSVLVRQEADLLILDEPTNDLDISMLESLEDTLIEFTGALVLVTHDRFMLEKVCNQFLGFTNNQELLSFGSYKQWEDSRNANSSKDTSKSVETKKQVKKMSEAERKEYLKMERKILKAEGILEKLQAEAGKEEVYSNPEESIKIASKIKEAESDIEALYARWEELEALR